MHLMHERVAYLLTHTLARLRVGHLDLWTIERPWVPGDAPGGKNFESCIPDGEYRLEPFVRANGDFCYCFVNPDLGVYRTKEERPGFGGRWACLYHAANYVDDVVGCAGPGRSTTIYQNRRMVTQSRDAMKEIVELLGNKEHRVTIYPSAGTEA